MNQEMKPTGSPKIFRPIEELCGDEPTMSRNKNIFRIAVDNVVDSPPSVARANPIDEEMRDCEDDEDIHPYPWRSPSAEEIEERQHFMLGMDMREEPYEDSLKQEELKYSDTTGKPVDFSMYFENIPIAIQDVDSDVDDVSFISYDEEEQDDQGASIMDEGFVLEPAYPAVWGNVLLSSQLPHGDAKRSLVDSRRSPAQVSVGSLGSTMETAEGSTRSPSPLNLKK